MIEKLQEPPVDNKFKEAMLRLQQIKEPMRFEIDAFSWFGIVSAIQLACRHPHFKGPGRELVESIARKVGVILTDNDPDLRLLLALGWQNNFPESHTPDTEKHGED
jgi:hypothetical protein